MKQKRRDPKRARAVLVHHELHRALADDARSKGFSIQDRLHNMLCEAYGRKDLREVGAVPDPMGARN